MPGHTREMIMCAALFGALPLSAQNPSAAAAGSPWKKLEFLLGSWTGSASEKDTPAGAGQGAFSFEAQLNQRIVLRRNHAQYDSGARHDDLMIMYLEAPNDTPRAIYFDSEGHVIRYNLSFPSPGRVVFESDGAQSGPRYRLSYWAERSLLNGRFEVAPPGGEYKIYLSWSSKPAAP